MSDKPNCYNRPPYKDTVYVQDGWIAPNPTSMTRIASMKLIPDPMSKDCKQHGPNGAATLYGWNCDGCRWKPA